VLLVRFRIAAIIDITDLMWCSYVYVSFFSLFSYILFSRFCNYAVTFSWQRR